MPLDSPSRESLLAACPLFGDLDADGLAAVRDAAVEVDFPAGRTIARQGEIGTGLFIVASGAVRVVRDGRELTRLGPGEFFGELAILADDVPRTARVRAISPIRCLVIGRPDFRRVLEEEPRIAVAMLPVLARRLADTLGA
jgi:CRP-like cAMP-binding protein